MFNPLDYLEREKAIFKYMGLSLNLDNPQTIQEKLEYLNFYDINPLKTKCADKILLHDYCKKTLGEDICVPIIKIYNSTNDIDWDELPNGFVIKCNHGSGMNIIVKDKSKLDKQDAVNKLNKWMSTDFALQNGIETHYHDIEHKIFAEKLQGDGNNDLTDYKFLCFNGKPLFCQVINDRSNSLKRLNYYDMSFNFVDLSRADFPNKSSLIDTKPNCFDIMKEYAEKLSKPFKFVRVDFYEIDGKVYLGELTFTPGACYFKYKNLEDNKRIGDLLTL